MKYYALRMEVLRALVIIIAFMLFLLVSVWVLVAIKPAHGCTAVVSNLDSACR
jgi:hypothetical protein